MARNFDGSNDRITWANVFNSIGTSITLSAKIRFDSLPSNFYVFCIRDTGETDPVFILEYTTSPSARWRWVRLADPSGYYSTYTTSGTGMPTTGTWYQLLVRASSGSPTNANSDILWNGAEAGTVAVAGASGSEFTGDSTWSFGADSDGTQPMDGQMAEVGVWNRLLTAAEVADLQAGHIPPTAIPNGLRFYCPMIGNTSAEINELGAAGTISGPTQYEHPRSFTISDN